MVKIYIYRPDMAKIHPNLLFTPKGRPYFEDRQQMKENRDKIEELKELVRWQKFRGLKCKKRL
jgi:hypothetical protein